MHHFIAMSIIYYELLQELEKFRLVVVRDTQMGFLWLTLTRNIVIACIFMYKTHINILQPISSNNYYQKYL